MSAAAEAIAEDLGNLGFQARTAAGMIRTYSAISLSEERSQEHAGALLSEVLQSARALAAGESLAGRTGFQRVDGVLDVDDDDPAELCVCALHAVHELLDRLHLSEAAPLDDQLNVCGGQHHSSDRSIVIRTVIDDHADSRVVAQKLCESLVDRQRDRREGRSDEVEGQMPDLQGRLHDASPSAGEGAEPGLASDLSVEGEQAAGASIEEAPAATPARGNQRTINPASLRAIRELAGMRGIDLARAAGISHGFLSNIEAGRKVPSVAVVRALARRLGVPIDAITQTT